MQSRINVESLKLLVQILTMVFCLLPIITPPMALVLGIVFVSFKLNSKRLNPTKIIAFLLQASIVFMGFNMDLNQVIATSQSGFIYTIFSVLFTIVVGIVLGKLFKVDKTTALLISCGTAICGGSAIAAISPVIKAKNNQITFALGVVFALNAVALLVFPFIGHYFNLSQEDFGYWAAIAIHDTSSVVGAGAAYGTKALEIATTVKLTRALWIIPMSVFLAFINKQEKGKIKIPWFIALFIVAILLGHVFPQYNAVYGILSFIGKKGLIIALFLIGSSIAWKDLKKVGIKGFSLGIVLWLLVSGLSLYLIN